MSDPYEILGLPPTATPDEIRQRYRQLAARYHPDHGVESWIFKQIRAAYEQLCENPDSNSNNTSATDSPASQTSAEPAATPGPVESDRAASAPKARSPFWTYALVGFLYVLGNPIIRESKLPWWIVLIGCVCLIAAGVAGTAYHLAWQNRLFPGPLSWPRTWLAFASFVLGLVGLASWMVPLYGWPVAIAGYLCGYSSHTSANRHLALIGMGLAIYSFVLTSGTFCYVASSASPWVTP